MKSLSQISMPLPIYTHSDNMSSIVLTENSKNHQHTKHIDIHYHWICEHVAQGQFKIIHQPGESLLADSFTKLLGHTKFACFIEELRLKKG
jgi:hypothetical protein